ncbi:MAG: PorT family protein [Bacteroidales bacterium]|nr:PorT family protein [Bacteroidales bacterium]
MKKIKLLLLLVTVGFSISTIAQFSVGPRVGVNLNKICYNYKDKDDEPDTKFRLGPNVGIMFHYQISDPIGIRTGIFLSGKGTSYDIDYSTSDTLGYINERSGWSRKALNYIEVPLEGTFGLKAGSGQVFVNFGAYFGVFLLGRDNWNVDYITTYPDGSIERENDMDKRRIKAKNTVTYGDIENTDYSYVKVIDFGLNMGVGYRIKFFLFNVQYGLGLYNITPDHSYITDYDRNDWKRSNRTISITVAFLFGGSKD